jgi:hypothetical protein
VCDLYKEPRLPIVITTARLRWAGYARRMNEEALSRNIMYVKLTGQRKTGRSKRRCKEVGKNARMLGIIRRWWSAAMNREE